MNELDWQFTQAAAALDRIGFDVGAHRISLWTGLVSLVVIVGIIAVALFGSRLARRLFARIGRLDRTQQLLGEKLVSILIWSIAFFVGIDILGIDLTALAVFSGAFGLAIGFGLQKTFGNLIAGIILLMDRSIKPGDVIAVKDGGGSAIGQVKKIGIRAVSVTTRDKKEYLIPNEILMTTQVENWSYSSKDVRVRVPVTIAYGCDLELAEKLMFEAARAAKRVLETPPPAVWITEFTEAGIAFEIRIWINDPEEGLGSVRSDVLKRVWQSFTEHGIALPDPGARNVRMVDDRKPGDFA
ncbi:MAG TPA: mechanosensitive ion channel domain-containing protein [Novosphingobium sp.]|nr:mechanosensitive ion channel domain-containing protein [Novosphingobium sp.]